MSRNAKIVVGVVAALLLVCLCGVVAAIGLLAPLGVTIGRTVELNPVRVTAAASNIADFTLPPNYRPEATVDLGGFLFVSYAPGDGHSHIALVQAPRWVNVDQATLEQYAEQAGPSRGYDRHTRSRIVGQTQATIRGQTATLVVGEGINSDGQVYRTLTGIFQGKGGPALVSVESLISRWNQAEVDAFLASIR